MEPQLLKNTVKFISKIVVDFGVVHILTQDVCNASGVANGSVSVTLSDGIFEGTDTILIKKK